MSNFDYTESLRKAATDSSGMHSNKNQKLAPEIISKEIIHDIKYSTGTKPRKFATKKSSRSRSKIAGLISKEYKEDLVEDYDILKTKLGHSNSFEAKIKSFNTLTPSFNPNSKKLDKILAYRLTFIDTINLKCASSSNLKKDSRNERVKYGTLNSTLDHKSMLLSNDAVVMVPNRNPSMGNIKIENSSQLQKHSPKRHSMNQPKYLKNMDLPFASSYQTDKNLRCTNCTGEPVTHEHRCVSHESHVSDELNIRSSGATVSYNDNNLLERQMENDQSKLVKER